MVDFFKLVGKIDNVGEILLGNYILFLVVIYVIGVNVVFFMGGFVCFYLVVLVFDFFKCFILVYLMEEGFVGVKEMVIILVDYEDFLVYVLVIWEWENLF